MTTSSNSTLNLIIEARNRASAALRSVTGDIGGMTGAAQSAQGSLQLLQTSIVSLVLLAPIMANMFASIAMSDASQKIIDYERGLRRARIQLQLMGFTAEDASDRLERLARILGEPTHRALVADAEALRNMTLAGDNLVEQITPMALGFAELLDLDVADTFDAIVTAITQLDPTKFIELVGAVEGLNLDRDSGILQALEMGDVEPFMDMIADFVATEKTSARERLAKHAEELLELVLPTQAAISEGAATFADVLVVSIIAALENVEKGKEFSVVGLLATWQWFNVAPRDVDKVLGTLPNRIISQFVILLGKEGSNPAQTAKVAESWAALGRTAARGFTAGLVGLMLPTLLSNIPEVLGSPELLVAVGVAGTLLGRKIGFNLATVLVSTAVITLGPGLVEMLENLTTDEKIKWAATAIGIIVSRFMRAGILSSLAIGTLIYTALTDIQDDDTAKLGMGILGALIGLTVGGRFGRVFSSLLGFEIGRGVREQFRGKTLEEIKLETTLMGLNLGKQLLAIGDLVSTSFNLFIIGAFVFTGGLIESLLKDLKANVIRELKELAEVIASIWEQIRTDPIKALTGGIDQAISQYRRDLGDASDWTWEHTSTVNENFGWNMPVHRAFELINTGSPAERAFATAYMDALKLGGLMAKHDEDVQKRRGEEPEDPTSLVDSIIDRIMGESDVLGQEQQQNFETQMAGFDPGGVSYGPEPPFQLGAVHGPVRPPSGPAVPSYTQDPASLMEGATSPYNTLVIQLKIDKKVIKEIAVEGVYEVARNKAGMFKGSIE